MMETALREDALTLTPDGFELRVGLPWIRSMPLSCIGGLAAEVDGGPIPPGELSVALGRRSVAADALAQEPGWWFIQDRLVLRCRRGLRSGSHAVAVDFQLMVPYLQAAPGRPLVLPFHVAARLEPRREAVPSAARDVA
ncbi:C-glycoside deglycosidase beta subunit domain-containing protein [Arthrobacter sp. C152]